MNNKNQDVLYGLCFFVVIVGIALLVLSGLNDYTDMHVFNKSPWLIASALTLVGVILLTVINKKLN
ncbi:hypothetical protein SAMN06298216_0382 [Spirosomataceae bacterium TFI 002]|nr:hypothetical protein SAMN06298216_0382 [Spirosomataceae bacterium TFI 002]